MQFLIRALEKLTRKNSMSTQSPLQLTPPLLRKVEERRERGGKEEEEKEWHRTSRWL